MLKNHINLSVGKKDNQEELKEKTELLNQYERKTMTERQTISLTHELKIEAKGKDYHEIMDIKHEFSLVCEHKEQTQKLLMQFLDLRALFEGIELDLFDEGRFQPLDHKLQTLVESISFDDLNSTIEQLEQFCTTIQSEINIVKAGLVQRKVNKLSHKVAHSRSLSQNDTLVYKLAKSVFSQESQLKVALLSHSSVNVS